MVFDTNEISTEGGQPIECYEITLGSTVYRWTSAEDTQTIGGNDFTPIEISRTAISQGQDDRDGTIELVVQSSNVFVQEYINIPPSDLATVEIIKFHRGDSANTLTIWKGKVQTVTFFSQNEEAKIACRPDLGTTSRTIPRLTFQVQCNHFLYDGQCQVSEASFRHTDTCTSVSSDGKTLTIANLSSKGSDWAVAGHVVFNGDKRTIFSQSGNNVTLHVPFRTSPVGSSVDVQAGCDHTAATCKSKFSNLVNFGGFPFIPNGTDGRDIFQDGVK